MSDLVVDVQQSRAEGLLVGASDAGAILGFDQYKAPISIWRRLQGLEVEHEDSEPAEWGKILEPVVRGKYAQKHGVIVAVPQESYIRDGWLRATPDGVTCGPTNDPRVVPMLHEHHFFIGGAGLVQCKTASAYLADDWVDGPPAKYEVQVRVEMAVTNLPWCDVACLIGGQRYVEFRVHREAALEENILRDLREFWEMAKEGREPNPDHTDHWRAHVSSKMRPSRVVITADADVRAWMTELRMARMEKKRAERQEAELKNKLLLAMSAGAATGIEDKELGKLTAYKVGGRTDWKAMAESMFKQLNNNDPAQPGDWIDAYKAKFTKPGTTWAIRTPSAWGGDDE